MFTPRLWHITIFRLALGACLLFVLLTFVAMLLYPGGTVNEHDIRGYTFFHNFFSDLGRSVTPGGRPNLTVMALFVIALTCAALGLVVFFVAFPQFFPARPWPRLLSRLGSFAGILTGLCFFGVACTPANLHLDLHIEFVFWAFRFFLAAVLCYLPAMYLQPGFPRRASLVFAGFAVLLAAYLALLTWGPSTETPSGLVIQAVGQKIIVYASILSVGLMAIIAQRLPAALAYAETTE